ncbi:MAG: hypothetical protein AB8E15_08215 [Bdellovibrionales bacterium]
MKLILSLLVMTMAFPLLAQDRRIDDNIRRMTNRLQNMVQNDLYRLDRQDKTEVRRGLREVIQIFQNGSRPDPSRGLLCETGTNKLINLSDGNLIHDFSNMNHCTSAKNRFENGKSYFCDFNDNTLRNFRPYLVHDFSNSQDCRGALSRVENNLNFCDFSDNTLRNYRGELIYDFGNARDCRNALNQMMD